MQSSMVSLCAIYWTAFDNVREGLYKNFNKLENKILRDRRVKLIKFPSFGYFEPFCVSFCREK